MSRQAIRKVQGGFFCHFLDPQNPVFMPFVPIFPTIIPPNRNQTPILARF